MINNIDNYKAVFEAMPGICSLLKADSPEFTIMAVTDGLVEATGMLRETLYGNGLFNLFPANPEDDDFTGETNMRTSFDKVIQQKKEHQLKAQRYNIPKGDGTFTVKYWQANNKPVLDEHGEVVYIIHYVVDITEKTKASQIQEKIKLEEQSYNLFMQAPIAICVLMGEEYVVELANEKILQIWRKEHDVTGKTLLGALPELKGTEFLQLLDGVRTTGKPYSSYESRAHFIKDGKEELVYFNIVYHPYYEGDSDLAVGVLVVANEVTDQVLARKKAEESEQRYRTLISEAVVATAVYEGREIRIVYANEAMIKSWGKDTTVIGKTIREALPELEGQPFHELLDNVFTTGETYWGKEDKAELLVDGELHTFYFNFTYKALRNVEGVVYGILNMSIDVTEQVLAQQKLQENEANLQRKMEERTIELELKNKELKRSNEELDQFAYIASHDLQEPLRKIRVFGDRLSKIIEPDSPTRLLVEKILSSAQRMSGLIDNLLDYSRLTINAYGFEKVDLNSVLHNILTDFELLITQKNAEITYDNLPVIEAIPLHMNQLFYNLIGNALKFTKKGVQPVITIKSIKLPDDVKLSFSQLNSKKEYLKITVCDNGIGFNQEYGNKIFTIFQRLNDRALYGGYGIGLALCKKVADTHEGIVYAEGKPKVGAAFTIILPLRHR